MRALAILAVAAVALASPAFAQTPSPEEIAPYEVSDANAGAAPTSNAQLLAAFHGRAGVDRIVDRALDLALADARIGPIFKPFDMVRLRSMLKEQFCYLLGGGCAYTGRDMKASHKDMGLQTRDLNVMIECFRQAMREEGVSNRAQNKLLAILAPMRRDVVTR